MGFYNKLKWILGILMVFVLIIATNLIDRNNFARVRDSVVTIYEDRLIAKELIFEMLKSVQQKELAVSTLDSAFFSTKNSMVNDNLQSLVARFEETKLTDEETDELEDLKRNVRLLIDSESQFLNSGYRDDSQVVDHIENLKTNLDSLSKIQISEGSRQMSISRRALDKVELFTQIEIYVLVILAIIIQVIVMYQPKEKS